MRCDSLGGSPPPPPPGFAKEEKFFFLPLFVPRCFVGRENEMRVEDCIERDKRNPLTDPMETSR